MYKKENELHIKRHFVLLKTQVQTYSDYNFIFIFNISHASFCSQLQIQYPKNCENLQLPCHNYLLMEDQLLSYAFIYTDLSFVLYKFNHTVSLLLA
jgi:hypothetical protein